MNSVEIDALDWIKGVAYPRDVRFRQIIVTGPPGSGKTSLIQKLGGWPEEGWQRSDPRLVSVSPSATVLSQYETLTLDVDFEGASAHAAYITPVPGGVGPMTIAMLLSNTVDAAEARIM